MAIGFVLVIVNFTLIVCVLQGILPDWVNDFAGTGMLLGLVLSIPPLILWPLSVLFGKLLRPFFSVASDLAERQVLRHRTRSALTTGVLFIAGATGVGMALSILDTVTNVRQWYDKAIQGDFFIRAMLPRMDTGDAPNLPDSVGEALAKIPEIDEYDPIKFTPAYSGKTKLSVISRRFERKQLPFDVAEGKRDGIWEAMQAGDIVVGSVLAQRMKLHADGKLELNTTHGPQEFRIAAVVNDYFGGGLTVYMPRHLAEKHFDISGSDGFAIFVSAKDRDAVEKKLQEICRANGVMLLSQKEIKSTIDGMVNTLNGCLWVLLVLGFVVSAFGVVNTLTMNVLEQTRELGMLRIVAMTRAQVRKTILIQALIIGMIGIAPGVIAGVAVALLINFAMTPTLGHAVSFHFHPLFLVLVWLGALAIVLIAAMIPAERAARIDVVDALHYE
jgi:putative ABC transport system permease protein